LPEFPHLLRNEVPIWRRFLAQFREKFAKFEYDVHVGKGAEPHRVLPPNLQKALRVLTQKRIDVVGYRVGEVWLFEVKPNAGPSALGAVMMYEYFYRRDRAPRERIIKAVVTDQAGIEMAEVFEHYGIRLFEVGR